jgi:probable F420-dependent oxidoreductase
VGIDFDSPIGVWWGPEQTPIQEVLDVAAEIEELGCGSLWIPEAVGREVLTLSASILSATRSMILGTGIANIHARDAHAAEAGARTLNALHPGRYVLGLGVSHGPVVKYRGGQQGSPLQIMQNYLDKMNSVPDTVEPGAGRAPRLLAALGPKMIELAGTSTQGAHTYLVTPEHTATARNILGSGPSLVVEQGITLTPDPEEAKRRAREHLAGYTKLPNYRKNFMRAGFEEGDLKAGGSDRFVDALIVTAGESAVAKRIQEHLDAGADVVCVQILGQPQLAPPVEDLRRLMPALAEIR